MFGNQSLNSQGEAFSPTQDRLLAIEGPPGKGTPGSATLKKALDTGFSLYSTWIRMIATTGFHEDTAAIH